MIRSKNVKRSIPKEATLRKWKHRFSWLKIIDVVGEKKMICKVYTSPEKKLKLMPSTNLTFINGSTNFKMSSLSAHTTTDRHTHTIREQENKKAVAAGLTIAPHKVVQEIPTYSAIGAGFKRIGETEKTALKKLFDIVHHIAVKGQPFTDFKDYIQLEKIHRVKFQSGSYENDSSCRDFIKVISKFFFQKDIHEKLLRVNFIAILCDGTRHQHFSNAGVCSYIQEVVYIFFVDPDTIEPTLTFFECLGLESSQDANSILDAIKVAFEKFKLSSMLDKVVFLSSDGVSVNNKNWD